MGRIPEWIDRRLAQARRLALFLDYDGTLADFAPTPDVVRPCPQVIDLLVRLAQRPSIWVGVISGRRLSDLETLLPVPGVLLAGTYGIELRTPEGQRVDRLKCEIVRPALEALKPQWAELITHRQGFHLEDKGWALALHARFAEDDEARTVLSAARRMVSQVTASDLFRVLGGTKFLEIAPRLAHKGRTVEYLLDHCPWSDALLLYLGDDDKDEEAFGVIKARGGIAIRVAEEPCRTGADGCLRSPQAARQWLKVLLELG